MNMKGELKRPQPKLGSYSLHCFRGIRQHKSDHGAWGVACISDPSQRTPMFIASPSPRNVSSELIFDRGVRKTIIYDQLSKLKICQILVKLVVCFLML